VTFRYTLGAGSIGAHVSITVGAVGLSRAGAWGWRRTLGTALVTMAALVVVGVAAVLGSPGAGAAAVFVCTVVGAMALWVLNSALTRPPELHPDPRAALAWYGRLKKVPLTAIGVWSLPADRGRSTRFLEYVARDSDGDLRQFIRTRQFVVVRGPSLAGKDRTLYEAAVREFGRATIVVPDPSVASCLADLEDAFLGGNTVIWLEDLNNYLELAGAGVNSGVTLTKLESWLGRKHWLTRKPLIRIFATIREDAWDRVDDELYTRALGRDSQDRAERIAWEIMHKGDRFDLPGLMSAGEAARASSAFGEPIPKGLSFGEFLVRMPLMLAQLERAQIAEQAMIWAAADWQRMGAGESLGLDALRSLWRAWVEQRSGTLMEHSHSLFTSALQSLVNATSDSTLSFITQPQPGMFQARDYFVAYREGHTSATSATAIPQAVWSAATKFASPDALVRIGARAEKSDLPSVAEASWNRAIEGGVHDTAGARAASLLAAHYADRHDLSAAHSVEGCLWAAISESVEPRIRNLAAWGLVELAVHYTDEGYLRPAIAIGERLSRQSVSLRDPELQRYVVMGESNLALNYATEGKRRDAIKLEERLAARLQDSSETRDRAMLATVMHNLAGHYGDEGDLTAAIATGEQVWALFRDDGEADIQAVVAGALANLANHYARSGDVAAAKAKEAGVWAGLGKVERPDWRLGYARGLRVLAIRYSTAGDLAAAIATEERLRREFGGSQVPAMQNIVAGGLFHLASTYAQAGDPRAAIAVGEEMLKKFGDARERELRIWVGFLSNNLANLYADIGNLRAAIVLGERIAAEDSDAQEPELRHAAALALSNEASHYTKAKQLKGAIATRQSLLTRFGKAKEPPIRQLVTENLSSLAENYHAAKDLPAAIATGERLWAEFGKDRDHKVRLVVARGLQGLMKHYRDAGELPAAARVARRLRDNFGRSAKSEERAIVATSMLDLSNLYANSGNRSAAIEVGGQLWVEFENDAAVEVRAVAASGLRTVAYRHGEAHDFAAATATVDRLWSRFGHAIDEDARASAVNSWRDLANWYFDAWRVKKALSTLRRYVLARRGI
jgi:tetratricopeptide (TPR) repeat protein